MAKFYFPLQKLLELRARKEQLVRVHLAEAQRQAAAQRQRLQELQAEAAYACSQATISPGEPVQPDLALNNDLYFARMYMLTLAQQKKLAQTEGQADQHRAQLIEAARGRKVIERLKERRLEEFAADRRRRENRQLDEVATVMFNLHRDAA